MHRLAPLWLLPGGGRPLQAVADTVEQARRPLAAVGRLLGPDAGGRRSWTGSDRLHIEVRGVDRSERLAQDLVTAAEARDDVDWARVNAPLGRLVVQAAEGGCEVGAVLAAVERVERAHGVGEGGFAEERFGERRRDHPADLEPLQRAVIGIAADVAGLGMAVGGRLARTLPLAPEVASLVSVADNIPQLRGLLERGLGGPATDLAVVLGNAAAQGLAQGPLSLVLDAAHRCTLAAEVSARRRVWERREPELCGGDPAAAGAVAAPAHPRPVPLPADAGRRYADRAWMGSLAALGLGLALTRDPRRAVDAALAGLPKAARLGPEAFAAQIGRVLAGRGVVPLDASCLRLLDRVDTVVLDAATVVVDEAELGEVVALGEATGDEAAARIRRRVASLFNPLAPAATRRRDGWRLAPLDAAAAPAAAGPEERRPPPAAATALRRLAPVTTSVLGLWHGSELVGLAAVVPQIPAEVHALVRAARSADLEVLVAGRVGAVAERLDAGRLPAGTRLAAAVRDLQRDGRVVALVSDRNRAALAAADCGIGLLTGAGSAPWTADLLCGPGLSEVVLLVKAVARAREVSRRSVLMALGGASLGGLLALAVGDRRAARRALNAANVSGLAAVAAGAWEGVRLSWEPQTTPRDRTPWHALAVEDVLARTGSSPEGLGADEAARRGADQRFSAAARADPPRFRLGRALVEELANPLTPVLAVGAAVSSMVGSAADAALIGGVLTASGLLGGIQRLQTDRAVRALEEHSTIPVRVRRDGRTRQVTADTLVAGDVVVLQAGDPVPADCRILEATSLEVDESSLTGESLPVRKRAAPTDAATVAERTSLLYEGTAVSAGQASAVVVAVGAATEAGHSLLVAGQAPSVSGVEARMRELTRATLPAALLGGAGVVAAGLLHRRPPEELLGTGVNLAIAAVPEGLPFLATVAQLGAARRLARRGALVRNPRTIEALGRVDTLCFDKTGTLTEGRISLQRVSCATGDEALDALSEQARSALAAGLRASPDPELGKPAHATDHAVLQGGRRAGVEPEDGQPGWSRAAELPFDPSRGFSAVCGKTAAGALLSAKGAPEVVLPRCRTRRTQTGVEPLDAPAAAAAVDVLARAGYRVLAVAERELSAVSGTLAPDTLREDAVEGLELLGFLALADPVRDSAAAAVRGLAQAGVNTVMITGDHPSTAEAIAAELGILAGGSIVTGAELDALDDEDVAALLPDATVYARVTPAHKVRIVEALQRSGRVVAMTGDGANDAPAIRLAAVGVAFTGAGGAGGAAAAREAADLVVTDGRIETLIDAIVEGRAMWSSVRDALSILLGGNLGEIAFTVAGTVLGGRAPLNPRQILLVNLATDLLPAMAIAMRPPRDRSPERLLREGPEASLGRALTQDMAIRATTTAAGATAAWLTARVTGRARRAQTIGLIALVGTQLGQTLVAGGRSPVVLGTSALSIGALAAVVQTPGVSRFFGCTPVGPAGWAIAGTSAAAATAAAWGTSRLLPQR